MPTVNDIHSALNETTVAEMVQGKPSGGCGCR